MTEDRKPYVVLMTSDHKYQRYWPGIVIPVIGDLIEFRSEVAGPRAVRVISRRIRDWHVDVVITLEEGFDERASAIYGFEPSDGEI